MIPTEKMDKINMIFMQQAYYLYIHKFFSLLIIVAAVMKVNLIRD